MIVKEELIEKVRTLSIEQIQIVSDFIDELDNDEGLDEDIKEFDRRLENIEKTSGRSLVSFEEAQEKIRQKLKQQ